MVVCFFGGMFYVTYVLCESASFPPGQRHSQLDLGPEAGFFHVFVFGLLRGMGCWGGFSKGFQLGFGGSGRLNVWLVS